jgi:hypothetical protein
VDRHPDSETLLAFREHRLSGAAVADVATHVGQCGRCAKVEAPAGRNVFEALVSRGADEHLSDQELDVLVDQRVHDPSYRAVSRHAATCAMCRAEVEDLRRFDEEEEAAPVRIDQRPSQRWLIAATIAFSVLALAVIALLLRRPEPAPVIASNPLAPVTPAPQPAPPKVVASLADAGGQIALLADGTLSGVAPLSPRDAEDARAVLSGQSIAIPTFIAAMPGAVRGDASASHPLRAVEPFRSAVAETRPRFSWTPVRGARGYRVAVFDTNYDEVAQSETLTGTSWTPSKALPSGVDLSWHVVADTDAGEVSSAGSNRAEAVFRVLTAGEAAEVDRGEAHYRDSHLLRGLLYSRHGLLHDAEREFRRLAAQNPGSPVARSLIESVSR